MKSMKIIKDVTFHHLFPKEGVTEQMTPPPGHAPAVYHLIMNLNILLSNILKKLPALEQLELRLKIPKSVYPEMYLYHY